MDTRYAPAVMKYFDERPEIWFKPDADGSMWITVWAPSGNTASFRAEPDSIFERTLRECWEAVGAQEVTPDAAPEE